MSEHYYPLRDPLEQSDRDRLGLVVDEQGRMTLLNSCYEETVHVPTAWPLPKQEGLYLGVVAKPARVTSYPATPHRRPREGEWFLSHSADAQALKVPGGQLSPVNYDCLILDLVVVRAVTSIHEVRPA